MLIQAMYAHLGRVAVRTTCLVTGSDLGSGCQVRLPRRGGGALPAVARLPVLEWSPCEISVRNDFSRGARVRTV